ncbi:uncharacterized protein LOC124204052 [Daphnia pulex]|uniref:uncharacterized protein LOC124204052 n=1 Tax=Daphnia pulex TaxID=6669 RepID=UPI001EDD9A30|nr:uncharacterized protein LOC124204052 [Daphnia pulex]
MLSLRIAVASCRFLSSRSSSAASVSVVKSNPPTTTAVDSTRKLRNNQIGVSEDGGQKFIGFSFYPRFPGQQDPPYKPSEALMIERVKGLKGRPYWEKDVMTKIGLPMTVKHSNPVIVANTPSMCAMLWKVKHLIRVTPITFPQGLPEDGDTAGARLQQNGQLVFIPKLKSDALQVATQVNFTDRPEHMDRETLKKQLRLEWIQPWK